MAVSASFHNNVFLLSQLIQPSDEFKKHFREGMFDKPNTTGFLYISHYLLTIYDSECFQKLVEWPVTCKKTEAKYRNNVKDYLMTIAMENPDIGFPNILASHMIHAGGTKFTLIMWKLSQIVMRKHIQRETTHSVIYVPQIRTEGLGKRFLQEITARANTSISNIYKDLSEMKGKTKAFLEKEKETLANIRTEIFEKELLLTSLSREAPVHDSVKKRLTDVNDADVIQLWEKDIHKRISYIDKKDIILRDIRDLTNRIISIIPGTTSNSNILDGKQLQKINYLEVSKIFPYIQCLLFQLYKGDKLILHNFISLFNSVLGQLHQQLKLNTLEDLAECSLQVKASCSDSKTALNIFRTHLSNITRMLEIQNTLCQKQIVQTYDDVALPIMNDVFLISSPPVRIDTNCSNIENYLQKRLELTPVEVAHKSLFSRYERLKQNHTSHGSKIQDNFLVSRINFDDTISTINSEEQYSHTRLMTPKRNLFDKQTGKYSQLFSSRIRRNNRAVNSSTMILPCSSRANSTAITSASEELNISELTLNISMKSLCNNSMECATPEKLSVKQENKSDNASEIDDVVNVLPNKPTPLDICKTIEVEIVNDCDNRIIENRQAKQKRRSIGDLVERYKKILERNNVIT